MKINAMTELFLPKDSHVWMNKSEARLSVSHASLFFNQETPSVSAHCSEGQPNTGLPVSDIQSTAWVWHIKFLASSQHSLNIWTIARLLGARTQPYCGIWLPRLWAIPPNLTAGTVKSEVKLFHHPVILGFIISSVLDKSCNFLSEQGLI